MTHISINPDDWVVTPPSIQNLIKALSQISEHHANAAKEEIERLGRRFKELSEIGAAIAAKRPFTDSQVVFLSDTPTTRQAKLAYGLRSNGWNVVLLHRNDPWFDPSKYFDSSARYSSEQDAVLLASLYSPTAYHVFSSWEFSVARALIDARPGKVVFDSYDTFAGCIPDSFKPNLGSRIDEERYCYEQSDGTSHRHGNCAFAHRKLGYKMPKPIFFPEYSWGGNEKIAIPIKPKRTDGIHCVYVGSMQPALFNDLSKADNVQDVQFTRSLTDRGIHYHVFPFTGKPDPEQFVRDFAPLLEEQEKNRYFHVHRPLPYEQLLEEISQFHFGVVSLAPEVPLVGNYYSLPLNFKRGTFNKAFDFIDAGLHMISYGYAMCERLLRGACSVVPRMEVADFVAQVTPESFMRDFYPQLAKVNERLSVVEQGKRLCRYYQSLHEDSQ